MGKDIEVAILFADVVGSTQLYEQLGDVKARQMVGRCLDIMREATEANRGSVIKTMGDEVMSTFSTADDAMNAARRMQERITTDGELAHDNGHVAIRIGCHYGPVVQEHRDIFGSAVHTANRMTSQAKAKQIITTLSTVERLSPEWQAVARQIDIATVRGRADEVVLFEVLWQPDEATSMLPTVGHGRKKTGARPKRLSLRYQGREVTVGEGRKSATLGRAEENDVVVKGNLISRVHARVEASRDKFTLVDESTNGTFVQTNAGEEIFVRRDSTQLTGEGVIGLGRVAQPGTALAVHYVVEE
ncbi:MAG TPA: adenylate/guanylate cyclase domain-containing protein [Gammaproteobacteria bacterium]|nr:adenylate/guanylate cyclase domain-containing protein [Gammaproteobacteria bacterium]